MLGAMDAVQKDGMVVNAAAAQFGVPPQDQPRNKQGRITEDIVIDTKTSCVVLKLMKTT